jgi:hypothetical protein
MLKECKTKEFKKNYKKEEDHLKDGNMRLKNA